MYGTTMQITESARLRVKLPVDFIKAPVAENPIAIIDTCGTFEAYVTILVTKQEFSSCRMKDIKPYKDFFTQAMRNNISVRHHFDANTIRFLPNKVTRVDNDVVPYPNVFPLRVEACKDFTLG
jgi:hypothetical protein